MYDDYAKELLRSGIIDARAGNKESARRYLDRALYAASGHDLLAEGWYWMSQVVDDAVERRKALENCLSHDLRHAPARRALAILDGRLKADEIINPDRLPPAPEGLRKADADRFMCPKCGGRMAFSPDGGSLVCEYCTRGQGLGSGSQTASEKDFVIAMATMKGHGKPLQEQVFHCQGCGSQFILPPKLISAACMYCGSPHVVCLEETKDLLAPDGVIPHAFDQRRATKILIEWVEGNQIEPEKKVDLPRGLYLPLWSFNVGGAIDYTAETIQYDDEEDNIFAGQNRSQWVRINDQYPIMVEDVPLPASRKLSAPLLKLIPGFEMNSVEPYDPRYLADWPAEVYDIPMADASLDARSLAFSEMKRDLPHLLGGLKIIHTSSANIAVESFKLILLPVWMTELPFGGRQHLVLINGQNGEVASDLESKSDRANNSGKSGGLREFLSDLLDDR